MRPRRAVPGPGPQEAVPGPGPQEAVPGPGPEEVERYERTRWSSWDQRWVHRREMRAAAELVGAVARPGDRVLDLPCGYGRLAGLLGEEARDVVGADRSAAMVRRARRRWIGDTPFRPCVAEVGAMPFPDDAFDGVVVFRLLQHLTVPEVRRAALAEAARVGRRWCLVSVYTGAPLHRLLRRVQGRPRKSVERRRLEADVAAAGLRIAARRRPLPWLHAQALWLLVPGRPGSEAGTGRSARSYPAPR